MKGSLATAHTIGKRFTPWATIGCSSHQPRSDIIWLPIRQAHGHDPSTMLRVMVRYSNHEVLEGKKSFMRSTSPAEEWFGPCNAKLTVSEVTGQPSIRLKLLQHALHGRAYLSFFVGSGLIDVLPQQMKELAIEGIVKCNIVVKVISD